MSVWQSTNIQRLVYVECVSFFVFQIKTVLRWFPHTRDNSFCRNLWNESLFSAEILQNTWYSAETWWTSQNSAEDRWLARQLENSDLEKYSCKIYQQGCQRHNHFYSCRNHDFWWFWHSAELCRILQNPADSAEFCRILQNRSSESACWRANGGLTPKTITCIFFFVTWIFQTLRRLLSTPNSARAEIVGKSVIFCRIKNPHLLQNENHRNSAEIEILQKPIDFFRSGKIIHRKLSPTRQQPQNAIEITPLLFFIGFWRPPGSSAMFNLPISSYIPLGSSLESVRWSTYTAQMYDLNTKKNWNCWSVMWVHNGVRHHNKSITHCVSTLWGPTVYADVTANNK